MSQIKLEAFMNGAGEIFIEFEFVAPATDMETCYKVTLRREDAKWLAEQINKKLRMVEQQKRGN